MSKEKVSRRQKDISRLIRDRKNVQADKVRKKGRTGSKGAFGSENT